MANTDVTANDVTVKSKICTKCGMLKPVTEFHRRGDGVQGYRSHCKPCWHEDYREASNFSHHKKNIEDPERYTAKRRRTYEKTRSDFLGCMRLAMYTRRRQCDDKGILFTITPEDIGILYDRQGGLCALTGRKLLWGLEGRHRDTLSVDRIVASDGYIIGNIRLTTYQANRARSDLPDTQLLKFCHAVLANAGETIVSYAFNDDESVPVAQDNTVRIHRVSSTVEHLTPSEDLL